MVIDPDRLLEERLVPKNYDGVARGQCAGSIGRYICALTASAVRRSEPELTDDSDPHAMRGMISILAS